MASGKRVPAAILAFMFGGMGLHKFYLGKYSTGVQQAVLSVATAGIGCLIGMVESLIYLTMSNEKFDKTYVEGDRDWF